MRNIQFIGDDFNDIYLEILELALSADKDITNRKGDSLLELINPSFELTNPRKCFAICRSMSLPYLKGELDFYLSGSPYLSDIARHSKFWNKCSDDGETINSNYGKLLLWDRNSYGHTQFEHALNMLLNNPESKKAVAIIYREEHAHLSNDNPCTMYLQFFIRNGKLDLFVKMRSSDIWFGLPYDVPFFVMIQFMMRAELAKRGKFYEIGSYNHNSGSLHLYHRNVEQGFNVLSEPGALNDMLPEPGALSSDSENLFEEYIESAITRWFNGHYSDR